MKENTVIKIFSIKRDSCVRKKPSKKNKRKFDSIEKAPADISSPSSTNNTSLRKTVASKLIDSKSVDMLKKRTRISVNRFKSPGIRKQAIDCNPDLKEEQQHSKNQKVDRVFAIDDSTVFLETKSDIALSMEKIQKELNRFGDIEYAKLSVDERSALVKYSIHEAAVNCQTVLNLPEEAKECLFSVRMAKQDDDCLFLSSKQQSLESVEQEFEGDCFEDVFNEAQNFSMEEAFPSDQSVTGRNLIVYDEW
eukprot:jgi/Galph1/2209/GphlegSOOS_G895.1